MKMWRNGEKLPGTAGRVLIGAAIALAAYSATPATAQYRHGAAQLQSGSYLAGRFAARKNDSAKGAEFYERALRQDPDNFTILRRAFFLEISAGRMARARKLAIRIVKANQVNALAHMLLGLEGIRERRFKDAQKHFENSAPHPVGKLVTLLLTAWAKAGAGDTDGALKSLAGGAAGDGFGIFRSYQAALIADLGGRDSTALGHYKQAYKQAGTSLRVIQSYGRFLERTGKTGEAIKLYKTYQKALPRHLLIRRELKRAERGERPERLIGSAREGAAETLFGIASATADQSGMNFALRYVRLSLHMRPKFAVGQILLGGILEDLKNYEGALAAYRSIDPSSPLKGSAELQVAENLDRLKRTDEARAHLENVAAKDPGNAQIHLVLGNILRGRSKFEAAAAAYTKAVEIIGTPTKRDWRLFYFRGISYERTKRWPQAEHDLQLALKLNPDQPSVLNYLGYSWIEQQRNVREALKILTKAVDLRPDDGYIIDSLGWAQYKLANYDEAVRLLERAVNLRSDDPVINDHLGDAYWHVERRREAKFQWAHARDLKPESEALKKILKKIADGMAPPAEVKVARADSDPKKATDAVKVATPDEKKPAPEKKVAVKPTPAPDKKIRYHLIQSGDSLWSISEQYLGSGLSYRRLLDANGDLVANPDLIYPGRKLIIPDSD